MMRDCTCHLPARASACVEMSVHSSHATCKKVPEIFKWDKSWDLTICLGGTGIQSTHDFDTIVMLLVMAMNAYTPLVWTAQSKLLKMRQYMEAAGSHCHSWAAIRKYLVICKCWHMRRRMRASHIQWQSILLRSSMSDSFKMLLKLHVHACSLNSKCIWP